MWSVKPDELSESSVLERRLIKVKEFGSLIVCVSVDDRLFEWVLMISHSRK